MPTPSSEFGASLNPPTLNEPRTVWTFRDALPLLMGSTDTVHAYFKKYGPVFRVRIAGLVPLVFMIGPEANRLMATAFDEYFSSQGFLTGIRDMLDGTLMAIDGAEHHRQRKIVGTAYRPAIVNSTFSRAHEVIDEHLDRAVGATDKVLLETTVNLSFDLHFRTLGLTTNSADSAWFYERWGSAAPAYLSPRWIRFRGSPIERAVRSREESIERMIGIIRERRANPKDDILSVLIQTHPSDVEPLSDREIALTILGNFLGVYGQGQVLGTLIQRLHENPKVDASLRSLLRGLPHDPTTVEEFKALPFLDHCIFEAERELSALVFRRVEKPFKFMGYDIEKGAIVPWAATFTHKAHIDRYDEFDPYRFANTSQPHPPYVFAPYGLGTRTCIGMHMARAHMRLIMSRFLRHYRVADVTVKPFRGGQQLFCASLQRDDVPAA